MRAGTIGSMAGTTALVALLGGVLASPATAGESDDQTFFRLKLSVEGSFTVDYGPVPGPNLSDYSGKATTSYSTDLVSVARYRRGDAVIGGKASNSKGAVSYAETTSVVSHFPGSEPEAFGCDNGLFSHRSGTVRNRPDGDVGVDSPISFVNYIGSVQISGEAGEAKEIGYSVDGGAHFSASCFNAGHYPLGHYLHSPGSSGVLLADTSTVESCCKVPRGAFNPNSDRGFKDSFSRKIHYDLGDNPHPENPEFPIHPGADYPHVFDGASEVSFAIKEISERKAKRLRKKFHKLPGPER